MTIYFEANLNTSMEVFISFLPVAFFLFLFFKFPSVLSVVTEILKVNPKKFLFTVSGLSVCIFIVVLGQFFRDNELHSILESKRYLSVSGCISSYQVQVPKPGSRIESFSVNDILFKYESYDATPYFKNANYRDDFIKNDRCVEIHYLTQNEKNRILRVIELFDDKIGGI